MRADFPDTTPSNLRPAIYRIVVEGVLSRGIAMWIDDAEVTVNGTQTELRISAADQAALHGVLRRIHDLHLKLVSVTRVD